MIPKNPIEKYWKDSHPILVMAFKATMINIILQYDLCDTYVRHMWDICETYVRHSIEIVKYFKWWLNYRIRSETWIDSPHSFMRSS